MLNSIRTRAFGCLTGLALLGSATAALAFETKAYDEASFKAAQAAGTPSIVHVTAPWCPTCKAQDQAIEGLSKDPAYAKLTLFNVDFDTQEAVMKRFKANTQSTVIAFSGATETGRMVGQTSPSAMASVFASTVKR